MLVVQTPARGRNNKVFTYSLLMNMQNNFTKRLGTSDYLHRVAFWCFVSRHFWRIYFNFILVNSRMF